jgi:hypothetical protein
MTDSVLLAFDPPDFTEAKDHVIAIAGIKNVDLNPHRNQLKNAPPTPEVLVYLAKVGVPALAGLVALWLGKGKRVTVKVGNRQINLSNVSEPAAQKLVEEFLNHIE